jgi:hypothetical protein
MQQEVISQFYFPPKELSLQNNTMNALALILLVRLAANPTACAHQLRGRVTDTTTLTTTGANFKDEVGFRVLTSIAMAKATTGGGAANAATVSDDAVILNNKDEAPFVIVASDRTTPPSATPAPAPMIATLAPIITGTPTMFPPTPEPTRPPSHSLERDQIATEAPSVLSKEGTTSVPTIASDATVEKPSNTFAPSASILEAAVDDEEVTNTTNTATTNGSIVNSTFTPTCVSSISYLYKEAELVTHCSQNSDCAGWTQDGPGCCLYPYCICGPMDVGSASVSCLAY